MNKLPQLNLAAVWNASIAQPERDLIARDYLWASQIAKPPVDIWLSMRGVQPTNKPNDRARRKFQAGNFFEHFVSMVLMRAGVVTEQQEEIWTDYGIRVKGKGDFVIHGTFDFDKAEHDIKRMFLPSSMEAMFLNICKDLKDKYKDSVFMPAAMEIKSVAETVMTRIEKANRPYDSHVLQDCHYKLGRRLECGVVEVICRDDLRLFEYFVTPKDEEQYINRIKFLADILSKDKQPEPAPLIIFDTIMGKFSKNLDVEYSSYLTHIYGYERPDSYADQYKPLIERWNRVLPRIRAVQEGKRGKPSKKEPKGKLIELTENNLAAINEMKDNGYDAYALAKVADVSETENAEE